MKKDTTTHTPGHWGIVRDTEQGFGTKPEKQKGAAICSVEKAFSSIGIHAEPDGKPCPDIDELNAQEEANACLIAAAPELLAILTECAKQLRAMGAVGHANKAFAIIEKATLTTQHTTP